MTDYFRKMDRIKTYNEPVLEAFQLWLEKSSLSSKTVQNHTTNIDFFAEYLISYEPLHKLDEADDSDVFDFLMNWYPRKAMWASEANTKSYMASFRKFFKYLRERNLVEQMTEDDVRETLKENKEGFIEAVTFDEEGYEW